MILRTAEVFGQPVVIADTHGVLEKHLTVVADFACGALGRRPPIVERRVEDCLRRITGRIVATGLDPVAKPLGHMIWRPDDCVAFGNEYDGLPEDFFHAAAERVWVPAASQYLPKPKSASPIDPARTEHVKNDGSVSLNVAATAAIIGHDILASGDIAKLVP